MNLMTRFMNLLQRERPNSVRSLPASRSAGVYVDEDRALSHAAVWASVRIISETIGTLPWRVHRKIERGNEILEGSLDYALHIQPNAETSAMAFRETLISHALLWGNGYAEIEWNMRGEVAALWPIPPDKTHADRTADGRLWYIVDGQPVLKAEDMFHLHGLGFDGITGYSVIRQAARSIGLGIALDQMACDTYANGAQPSGVIVQNNGKALSTDGVKNLLETWERRFRGPGNGGKVGYLDAGMEYKALSMPLTDAQFLESRRFQVAEIARWFRVPPHKLADLERATFSNIEHQSLEFVTDALVPWATRLEQEAQIKLIGRNNRAGKVYTKINFNALLRGDLQSRYAAYAVGRQWGWLSPNDVRELEDMNPIRDGDLYLVPANMTTADRMLEPVDPSPPPVSDNQDPPANLLRAVK